MALSEEHKAAMKAGRIAAAERRRAEKADPGREHAEHRERVETAAEQLGVGAIDESKLNRRDREILDYIEKQETGVENPQPGYRYFRVTVAAAYSDNGSKANIRYMHSEAKRFGAEAVHGEMPEDEKFKGNDHTSGTTLRGIADTVLYRMRDEEYQRMVAYHQNKAERQGAVEENGVVYARDRLGRQGLPNTMHGVAGDFSQDPVMDRIAGPSGRVERFAQARPPALKTNFTEGDLRRGSMKGPDGRTLPPGFERRV